MKARILSIWESCSKSEIEPKINAQYMLCWEVLKIFNELGIRDAF